MYGFKKRSSKGYKSRKTSSYRGSAPRYRPYSRGGYGRRYKRPMGSIARRRLNTHYQRGARSKVIGKYRGKRSFASSIPSRSRIARIASLALGTSGTFTEAGLTSRLSSTVGSQVFMSAQCNPWLSDVSIFYAVISGALIRAMTVPNAAGGSATVYPTQMQNFWIRSGKMKLHITNTSQIDCDLIFYPYTTRYDTVDPSGLYTPALVNATESLVGSSTSQQKLLSNETSTIGWTPFMSRWITQHCKPQLPTRHHRQGGHS